MTWQTLDRFRDPSVPKLDNLRRAQAAGLRVPPTWWTRPDLAAPGDLNPPAEIGEGPLIVRSASTNEDRRTTSNAGQLLSLVVPDRSTFAEALRRVASSIPRVGAVFIQPLVAAEEAGVAFFDGFYYERALAAGSNLGLTSGQERGVVRRGHLERGEPWSIWLESIYSVFGEGATGDRRLDVEFARDARGFVLLQVRPALFPVLRNPTLTLANHKETLGELPSPWAASAIVEAGLDLSHLIAFEPAIAGWEEVYGVELAGRAWMNLSLWFRWVDRFGLPRTLVTNDLGGVPGTTADARANVLRFLRYLPTLTLMIFQSAALVARASRSLGRLEDEIERARDLAELYRATVSGSLLGLHTNFALTMIWSVLVAIRRTLRLPGTARLVTHEMMDEYNRLATLTDPSAREEGLSAWLARYGHRGPMESDPARPRFAELREVLRRDLDSASARSAAMTPATRPGLFRRIVNGAFRPLYFIDERREWYRDAIMRRWRRLRARMLELGAQLVASGELDAAEDVFFLRGTDLTRPLPVPLREAARAGRARTEVVRGLELPLTASREAIEEIAARPGTIRGPVGRRRTFPGIALAPLVVEGRAVKADDLLTLLAEASASDGLLGPDAILVVPALEPSWAVLFPRVGGVVADVGGELSHASILLREARRPALVNCVGIFREVRTGDRVRLDGPRGQVELLDVEDGIPG